MSHLARRSILSLFLALAVGIGVMAPPGAPPASAAPLGGTFTDHGGAVPGWTIQNGVFGTWTDGRLVSYQVNWGPRAHLSVSTVLESPNTTLYTVDLPAGANGSHSMVTAPDGSIYFGTWPNGRLFRFVPSTKVLTDLGQPISGNQITLGLSAASDGRIALGTTPSAHTFIYTPGSGFTDLGKIAPTISQTITFSTAFDLAHNRLYVGAGSANEGLYSIDLATKAQTLVVGGLAATPIDITVIGNRALSHADGKLIVVDTATNTLVTPEDAAGNPLVGYLAHSRGFSQPLAGVSYFTTAVTTGGVEQKRVAAYDLATDTITTSAAVFPEGPALSFAWTTVAGQQTLVSHSNNYAPSYMQYTPATDTALGGTLAIPGLPQKLWNVLAQADGSVLANAYLNGSNSRLDPTTNTFTPTPRFGQTESILGDGSMVYAGVYPGASIMRYDNSNPTAPAVELVELGDYSDGANRPWTLAKSGNTLYVGTIPKYGQNGGAIAAVSLTATPPVTPTITRNVVPNHSIAALAVLPSGNLLVGSSTDSDGPPVSGAAKLVEWNPSTKATVRTMTPNASSGYVNALLVEGSTAFALAGGNLVEINLSTWAITRTVTLAANCGPGYQGEIARHPYNSLLYVSCATTLYEVDNSFVASAIPIGRPTQRMSISPDGSLYFITTAPSGAWDSNIGSWRPNHPATVGCTGAVSMYGVLATPAGPRLTYAAIDAKTNRRSGGTMISTTVLPFTPVALAAVNFNTVMATAPDGKLHQINIQSLLGTVVIANITEVGYGWAVYDKVTSDGSYLYATTTTGQLYRYSISVAKPGSTFGTKLLIGSGFVLKTLAASAPGRLVATTAAGALLGYSIPAGGGWSSATLKPSTWVFDQLTASNGMIYALKSTDSLWGYRDVNPSDGSGADIGNLGPVDLRGWSQDLISAVPTSPAC